MNERLSVMRQSVRNRECKRFRRESAPDVRSECDREGLSWMKRAARLTRRMCEAERVIIEPDERIVFTRTVPVVPPLYSEVDYEELTRGRVLHEKGPINNICADWGMVLGQGLAERRRIALTTRARLAHDEEAIEFLDSAVETIDAVQDLACRYASHARKIGRDDIAEIMERVPARPPRGFREALQALRICHAAVWLGGHYHVGFGRLDQYLWPYLEADLDTGRLTVEGAEELLAEFFITLNRDSDLYPSVIQGDNGQTIMLGGIKRDGSPAVNPLTWMVLRVSRDVAMIDPKINLRITAETDLRLLALATELTRKGLGFPQYSNDSVVIPALVAHGYALEDARDYAVAACWEFLVPGKGMEVVNFGAVQFPVAADRAIREALAAGGDFDAVLGVMRREIQQQVNAIVDRWKCLLLPPAPYYSVVMDGCLEDGHDISLGGRYTNIGVHGACSASAADALAAVRRFVFEEQSVPPAALLAALDADFVGYDELRRKLADEGPRVGNNDEAADGILAAFFNFFADACEDYAGRGLPGIIRPGTGTASQYIKIGRGLGATAEGRRHGEPFSANLAPAPGARIQGPISVLQSFARIDYQRICNGGPITMELSDTVFRDADCIRKVAMLVQTFAHVGCQQLQLNALSFEQLVDAKAHPELHRDLIVRVWGWSGYFCELAPEYQDHVIRRHQYVAV